MSSSNIGIVSSLCPSDQCIQNKKFDYKNSKSYEEANITSGIEFRSGNVSAFVGKDFICLPKFECSKFKMQILTITAAELKYNLVPESSGVLGLAPGGEGNYYGNLMPFLKATGKVKEDNFAFKFTEAG